MAQDEPDRRKPPSSSPSGPTVIMVCGVNGSGKTTTIAKLAQAPSDRKAKESSSAPATRFAPRPSSNSRSGASGSARRSSRRAGQPPGQRRLSRGRAGPSNTAADVCIVDTAGRLQTQKNLMKQLTKIHRVIGKQIPEAPHEVLLVLDATTGQNGISQAATFHRSRPLHGHRAGQARRHGQGRRGRCHPPAARAAGEIHRRRRKSRRPRPVRARSIRRRVIRRSRHRHHAGRSRPAPSSLTTRSPLVLVDKLSAVPLSASGQLRDASNLPAWRSRFLAIAADSINKPPLLATSRLDHRAGNRGLPVSLPPEADPVSLALGRPMATFAALPSWSNSDVTRGPAHVVPLSWPLFRRQRLTHKMK